MVTVIKPLLASLAEYTGLEAICLIGGRHDPATKQVELQIVDFGDIPGSIPKGFSHWDKKAFKREFCGTFSRFIRELSSELSS